MVTMTRSRQRLIAERMTALQDRLRSVLQRALARYFRELARRTVVRLNNAKELIESLARYTVAWDTKAEAEELVPEEERRRLEALIKPLLTEAFLQAAGMAGDLVGLDDPLPMTDPRVQTFLNEAGARITDVHETTVRTVRRVLQAGHVAGYSPSQIANGVPKDGFAGLSDVIGNPARAETIARTEIAIASQQGTHERYQQARISMVDIMDGAGCGWTEHDDPDEADGSRRTLIEAQQYPISHPNCVRVSLPVLER